MNRRIIAAVSDMIFALKNRNYCAGSFRTTFTCV